MQKQTIQIQQSLFSEQEAVQKSSFVESYLKAHKEVKEALQDGILSSCYMTDFICLAYAMWLDENSKGVQDIDKDYLNFVLNRNFKFFAIPKNDSLMLKVSGNLTQIEDEFDRLMTFEQDSYKDAILGKYKTMHPEATTEELIEMVADALVGDEMFTSEKWSTQLSELFELRNRAYWIYTHMMEMNIIENAPQEIAVNVVQNPQNSYLQMTDFVYRQLDMRSISVLRQKMLFSADVQKVYFNNIPLTCRAAEAIIFLARGTKEQVDLVRNYLLTDQGGSLNFRKLRRVISSLPYLTNESLAYITPFMEPFAKIIGEADREFIEYAIDNGFIPEESMSEINDIFEVMLNDDDDNQGDENQESEFEHLFKEVCNELPEEVRKQFDDTSNKHTSFMNLKFEDNEEVNKENIRKKILAIVEKLGSDSHSDITTLSDILYEWFPYENLLELSEKEQTSGVMDGSPPANYYNLINKIQENNLKPKIVFTPEMQVKVEELKEELPNFADVIDFIVTEVKLNLIYNGKMSFTPILLLGDAGLGKTYVAKEIAGILKTGFDFIDFGSASASWLLKGSSMQWKAAAPGKILEAMANSNTINPVVLYDEIDKGIGSGRSYPPEVVLYQLFEKNNSSMFEDEFLGMHFDASTIINICTANTRNNIPQPLQSRLNIFEVKKLNAEQTRFLAQKMYKKMVNEYTIFSEKLDESILDLFKDMVPREIDRALRTLLIENTKRLSMEDLLKGRKNKINLVKYTVEVSKKPTIGFTL